MDGGGIIFDLVSNFDSYGEQQLPFKQTPLLYNNQVLVYRIVMSLVLGFMRSPSFKKYLSLFCVMYLVPQPILCYVPQYDCIGQITSVTKSVLGCVPDMCCCKWPNYMYMYLSKFLDILECNNAQRYRMQTPYLCPC